MSIINYPKSRKDVEIKVVVQGDMIPLQGKYMKKVIVIPIVVGALGAVSKELDKYIEKIGITLNVGHVQNTAI